MIEPIETQLGLYNHGKPITDVAAGIVTTGKRQSLELALHGLHSNGFTDITLFADGPIDNQRHPTAHRSRQAGIFSNWYLGLLELRFSRPNADAYLYIQDDTILVKGAGDYLRNAMWLEDSNHIVSAFTQETFTYDKSFGWHKSDKFSGGLCALLMSATVVDEIISMPYELIEYSRLCGNSANDLGIFKWATNRGYNVFYPWPSLAEHYNCQSTHNKHPLRHHNSASKLAAVSPRPCRLQINDDLIIDGAYRWSANMTLVPGFKLHMQPDEYLARYFDFTPKTMVHQIGSIDDLITDNPTICQTTFNRLDNHAALSTVYDINRPVWRNA